MTVSWKDSVGRSWDLALNLGLARRIRDELGLELLDSVNGATTVAALLANPDKLGDLLWLTSETRAKAVGLDRQAFDDGLNSDALTSGWGALHDAFLAMVTTASRPAAEKIIATQVAAMESACRTAVDMLDAPETKTAINQAIQQAANEVRSTLVGTSA